MTEEVLHEDAKKVEISAPDAESERAAFIWALHFFALYARDIDSFKDAPRGAWMWSELFAFKRKKGAPEESKKDEDWEFDDEPRIDDRLDDDMALLGVNHEHFGGCYTWGLFGECDGVNMIDAADLYQRDARFRAICLSAVARAMDERRAELDGEIEKRDVHDVALLATVIALKQAFDENKELAACRVERDHYKAVALRGLELAPTAPIILQTK